MPAPAPATAFLSYTRTDDDFHGGYITSFRKMLENAVRVVTGDKTFQVFQDVEGIVIGEQWQKKLSEAINRSSVLVPMLTPLFFNSGPCRDEVTEFLAHERTLERDDLILPIYFFTSPRLEKEDERVKDSLARELAKRQLFDWRERADVALDQPAARRSMVELAGQIAVRLRDVPVEEAFRAPDLAIRPGRDALADAPELSAGIAGNWKREAPQRRTVLWVDDNPGNNVLERRALESYGMQFVLARDTASALHLLAEGGPFSAIVSDMGRADDGQAGMTLLRSIRKTGANTPYFIYTTRRVALLLGPVVQLQGAQGITADPDALVQMVVAATRVT